MKSFEEADYVVNNPISMRKEITIYYTHEASLNAIFSQNFCFSTFKFIRKYLKGKLMEHSLLFSTSSSLFAS